MRRLKEGDKAFSEKVEVDVNGKLVNNIQKIKSILKFSTFGKRMDTPHF